MSRRAAVAGGILCAALAVAPAGSQDCPGPLYHALFPQDIYVLRGFVTEVAALPAEDDGAYQLEVQNEGSVHLPVPRSRYVVTVEITEEDCSVRSMSAPEMRDRFAVGDEVKIVARAVPGSRRSLVAPFERVALVMAEAGESRYIKNTFDYYEALLELDERFHDHDKFSLLSQMGRYLDSRDEFENLLEEQIQQRRLRRQLLSLYDVLREQ
ncbi:MAG: hypothetical protein OXG74_09840 [Acidobacteria bacterium]|nr:hypothetical protein [Acidobacteriota bacterium]